MSCRARWTAEEEEKVEEGESGVELRPSDDERESIKKRGDRSEEVVVGKFSWVGGGVRKNRERKKYLSGEI